MLLIGTACRYISVYIKDYKIGLHRAVWSICNGPSNDQDIDYWHTERSGICLRVARGKGGSYSRASEEEEEEVAFFLLLPLQKLQFYIVQYGQFVLVRAMTSTQTIGIPNGAEFACEQLVAKEEVAPELPSRTWRRRKLPSSSSTAEAFVEEEEAALLRCPSFCREGESCSKFTFLLLSLWYHPVSPFSSSIAEASAVTAEAARCSASSFFFLLLFCSVSSHVLV